MIKLTKKQQEVLTWIQRGAANKHIAKRMGISESTVKLHIGFLLKKYAATNRSQLILFSMSNSIATFIRPPVEEKPIAWVKREGEKIKGFMLGEDSPGDGWEPLYVGEKP